MSCLQSLPGLLVALGLCSLPVASCNEVGNATARISVCMQVTSAVIDFTAWSIPREIAFPAVVGIGSFYFVVTLTLLAVTVACQCRSKPRPRARLGQPVALYTQRSLSRQFVPVSTHIYFRVRRCNTDFPLRGCYFFELRRRT